MAIVEKLESSNQKRVQEMIAARGAEKVPAETAPISTAKQIEAAKMLEMEAQKREERAQNDRARIKELQAEIKPKAPKIELDLSKDVGVVNKGRRGAVLAAENAFSKERPDVKPAARQQVVPPPQPKKGFWEGLFS